MKHTRGQLLAYVNQIRLLIGDALAANHDRNTDRFSQVTRALNEAHELCIDAASTDPPVTIKRVRGARS